MVYIKERPKIRQGILNYCEKNSITIVDLYVDFPCSNSVRKQLKLMLIETDQLDLAKERKARKEEP